MMDTASLITIERACKAFEPNPNSGVVYYKLEPAILHTLINMRDTTGMLVQAGQDPNDADMITHTFIRYQVMCGNIVDINDQSVLVDVADDYIDMVWRNLKNLRIFFNYIVDNAKDPMSNVRFVKAILASIDPNVTFSLDNQSRDSSPTSPQNIA